ncbi:hypothetical protein T439DRAFT_381999 [Meredithblackwellia eburnea MCA 4105]
MPFYKKRRSEVNEENERAEVRDSSGKRNFPGYSLAESLFIVVTFATLQLAVLVPTFIFGTSGVVFIILSFLCALFAIGMCWRADHQIREYSPVSENRQIFSFQIYLTFIGIAVLEAVGAAFGVVAGVLIQAMGNTKKKCITIDVPAGKVFCNSMPYILYGVAVLTLILVAVSWYLAKEFVPSKMRIRNLARPEDSNEGHSRRSSHSAPRPTRPPPKPKPKRPRRPSTVPEESEDAIMELVENPKHAMRGALPTSHNMEYPHPYPEAYPHRHQHQTPHRPDAFLQIHDHGIEEDEESGAVGLGPTIRNPINHYRSSDQLLVLPSPRIAKPPMVRRPGNAAHERQEVEETHKRTASRGTIGDSSLGRANPSRLRRMLSRWITTPGADERGGEALLLSNKESRSLLDEESEGSESE